MGTNYYLLKNPCVQCGRSEEKIHIGKSSGGWCFALHVIPEEGLSTLEDWMKRLEPPNVIQDEYGTKVFPLELLKIITERKHTYKREGPPMFYDSWAEFHRSNHSVDGPSGLVRAKVGDYCVGHGHGTWDLIPGEFS